MSAALAEDAVPQPVPPVKKKGTATKKTPPAEHVELPKPEELASPYPKGTKLFTYKPKDGGDPILLPLDGFERPDKVWLFDLSELPVLSQTWSWLRRAKVPKSVQRQAQFLPDPEYFAMFDVWFAAMRAGATAGE
jgi:hypothetical protein